MYTWISTQKVHRKERKGEALYEDHLGPGFYASGPQLLEDREHTGGAENGSDLPKTTQQEGAKPEFKYDLCAQNYCAGEREAGPSLRGSPETRFAPRFISSVLGTQGEKNIQKLLGWQ